MTSSLLPEETLHARRETAFLVLAALALLPAAMLVLLAAGHVIDLSALVARLAPSIDVPVALQLPLAAAPFALSLITIAVACELFGRRRAGALVWTGGISAMALAGLVWVADVVDGGAAFGVALAAAVACVVALVSNVVVVEGLRSAVRGRARYLRLVAGAFVASMLGFAAFAGVVALEGGNADAVAAGSAVWTFALASVLAIPAAFGVRLLAVTLRLHRELDDGDDDYDTLSDPQIEVAASAPAAIPRERFARASTAPVAGSSARSLPAAEIVDEDVVPLGPESMRRRAARVSLQPFSSAEMEFFREGDALE